MSSPEFNEMKSPSDRGYDFLKELVWKVDEANPVDFTVKAGVLGWLGGVLMETPHIIAGSPNADNILTTALASAGIAVAIKGARELRRYMDER